jgi:hypothetical protein
LDTLYDIKALGGRDLHRMAGIDCGIGWRPGGYRRSGACRRHGRGQRSDRRRRHAGGSSGAERPG